MNKIKQNKNDLSATDNYNFEKNVYLLQKIKDATQIFVLKNIINYGAVKYCSFASINQTKKAKYVLL